MNTIDIKITKTLTERQIRIEVNRRTMGFPPRFYLDEKTIQRYIPEIEKFKPESV